MLLFLVLGVATQAIGTRFLPGERFEADDLADIASAFHVFRSGAVTGLTAVAFAQCCFEMRGVFEVLLIDVLMA